jgi:hypothetical protein
MAQAISGSVLDLAVNRTRQNIRIAVVAELARRTFSNVHGIHEEVTY